jgi:hypothetical protein
VVTFLLDMIHALFLDDSRVALEHGYMADSPEFRRIYAGLEPIREAINRARRPPRNRERNAEIVRLHDGCGWSYGRIGKRLGMKAKSVESAYRDEKRRRAEEAEAAASAFEINSRHFPAESASWD